MRITRGRRIGRVAKMPLFQGVITGTMPTYLRFPFLEQLRSELADLVFAADPAHRVPVTTGSPRTSRRR